MKEAINKKVEEEHLDHSGAFDYMLEIAPQYGLTPAGDVEELKAHFESRNAEREAHRRALEEQAAELKRQRDAELGRTVVRHPVTADNTGPAL